jgi:hypothetical protein
MGHGGCYKIKWPESSVPRAGTQTFLTKSRVLGEAKKREKKFLTYSHMRMYCPEYGESSYNLGRFQCRG